MRCCSTAESLSGNARMTQHKGNTTPAPSALSHLPSSTQEQDQNKASLLCSIFIVITPLQSNCQPLHTTSTEPPQPTLGCISPACLALRPGSNISALSHTTLIGANSCNLSPPCLLNYDTRPQLPLHLHLPSSSRLPTTPASQSQHPLHHHRRSRR